MGFFVNEYLPTGNENIIITDSLKTSNAIYYCGHIDLTLGYIKKLDLDGNVLWSKSYALNAGEVIFNHLVDTGKSIACSFKAIFTNESEGNNFTAGIICVDSNGNNLWNKIYLTIQNSNLTFVSNFSLHNQNFILIVANNKSIHTIKISESSQQVILSKKVDTFEIVKHCFEIDGSIFICTHRLRIIKLDVNFNLSETKGLDFSSAIPRPQSPSSLERVSFAAKTSLNGFLYVHGFVDRINAGYDTFLAKLQLSTLNVDKVIVYEGQLYPTITTELTNLYVSDFGGVITSKFNENLDVIFSKDVVGLFKVFGNSALGFSQNYGVRHFTNLDLDSCVTENATPVVSNIINGVITTAGETPTISNFTLNPYSPPFTVTNVSLSVNLVCGSQDPVVDLNKSTITANPTIIDADGTSTSQITVQLRDSNNAPLTTAGNEVVILTNAGTLEDTSGTSNNSGVFQDTLTSSSTPETATLQFTVDGEGPSPNEATVVFGEVGDIIPLDNDSMVQSDYLYLQSVGSDGTESTEGRHLRWALRGVLGELHLPKGDEASNTVNFNKPKDFVTIYKANYRKKIFTLNFQQQNPSVVDNSSFLWIYRFRSKDIYVYFRNTDRYNQALQSQNPSANAFRFLKEYGDALIEVENKNDLFFAVELETASEVAQPSQNPEIKTETLSVESNSLASNKAVTTRTIFDPSASDKMRLVCENGRSIRFIATDVSVGKLHFEYYSDFISNINQSTGWESLGEYSLSLDNAKVLSQLEPEEDLVHGVWKRFNEEAFVNIDNYETKWNGPVEAGDRNTRQIVEKYIQLSDNASNPTATENIPLGNDPNDPSDYVSVSNLDILNLGANDYHIARMLGLGLLDTVNNNFSKGDKFVYVALYETQGDLQDGDGARYVRHLYMSLPTGNDDLRLPLPVDLDSINPGIFINNSGETSEITDEGGYTHDGLLRYVSIFNNQFPETQYNPPFFQEESIVDLSLITPTVYGGLEHKIGSANWDTPELSNDSRYLNEVPQGTDPYAETRFIIIPQEGYPYYIHRQHRSGTHTYKGYGINWFSRANDSGIELQIDTLLAPKNALKPPSNTNCLLIRDENPLILTSENEQVRLQAITQDDKTLIRLTFNYHTYQELKTYKVPLGLPISNQDIINGNENFTFPDNEEIFAEEVEIFFRPQVPNNVTGKAISISDHTTEETLAVISTGDYFIASTGETLTPEIPSGTEANFIGGAFILGENRYIIQSVESNPSGPIFTVYKREISDSIYNNGIPEIPVSGILELPINTPDGLFMAIENMQNATSWGTPNPLDLDVIVDSYDDIHREVIQLINSDGLEERYVEKTRGIWESSIVSKVLEPYQNTNGSVTDEHQGLYKIVITNFTLQQHPQFQSTTHSVEWYRGLVRLFTESALQSSTPSQTRKNLEVLKFENVSGNLEIYAQDPSFPMESITDPSVEYDYIKVGTSIEVNFYPGYRVYLYEKNSFNINEETILPSQGEGMRHTIFGFRSKSDQEVSKISIPAVLFAQELIPALPPEQPLGPLYTTRPDFFGRATYTFTTKYSHQPHGVLFYRANDEGLLNALYEKATVRNIRQNLKDLGGNEEEYLTNRWQNFLDFTELASNGDYSLYPPIGVSEDGYKFPNPDKQAFFDWANSVLENLNMPLINDTPGSLAVGDPKILNFVRGAIYSVFVPLTEVPIIYQYLKGADYKPVNEKQTIRDRDGNIISPGEEGFDMAPMMKVIGTSPNETLYTDFNIDATSNNLYFYGVKELSSRLEMSPFSPFLGPIKQVNANPAETPEVKRIIPVLRNEVLGIEPKIKIEVNAVPEIQNIKKVVVYRSLDRLDAQSVRSMQKVKTVDLESENLLGESIWTIEDDFSDLSEIPFGETLFYRITVLRKIEYAKPDTGEIIIDYAPSQSSKIVASVIVENRLPNSPTLTFGSTPPSNDQVEEVTLFWQKTVYNAYYQVFKMNNNGNWQRIHRFQSNDEDIALNLYDTELNSDVLRLKDSDGNDVFHHFKVLTENTSGMISSEENILTIFNPDLWTEL